MAAAVVASVEIAAVVMSLPRSRLASAAPRDVVPGSSCSASMTISNCRSILHYGVAVAVAASAAVVATVVVVDESVRRVAVSSPHGCRGPGASHPPGGRLVALDLLENSTSLDLLLNAAPRGHRSSRTIVGQGHWSRPPSPSVLLTSRAGDSLASRTQQQVEAQLGAFLVDSSITAYGGAHRASQPSRWLSNVRHRPRISTGNSAVIRIQQ